MSHYSQIQTTRSRIKDLQGAGENPVVQRVIAELEKELLFLEGALLANTSATTVRMVKIDGVWVASVKGAHNYTDGYTYRGDSAREVLLECCGAIERGTPNVTEDRSVK
jgi:hypothetical protein